MEILNSEKEPVGALNINKQTQSFYNKYLKHFFEELHLSEFIKEELIMEILAVFISGDIFTPKRIEDTKQATTLLKQALRKFSPKIYTKLFEYKWVQYLFQLLKASGIIEGMLNSNVHLKMWKEAYINRVDSIINFRTQPKLMK